MWIAILIVAVFLLVLGLRFRAMRVLGTLLAFILIAFLGPLTTAAEEIEQEFSTSSSSTDSSIIRDYTLDYGLATSGELKLVETLDVRFTETRRGIFRFFDPNDPQSDALKHPVTVVSVERCTTNNQCAPEPYTTYTENGFLVARIGDASVGYPAGTVNRYRITSTTTQAITQVEGQPNARWYWDVIGRGWQMPIRKATVTAQLPATPTGPVQCATGEGTCTVAVSEDNVAKMSLSGLPPRSPATWLVPMAPQGLTVATIPNANAPTLWDNLALQVSFVLAGVLLAEWLGLSIRKHIEPKPATAPIFSEPGPGLLSSVWTLKERPTKHAFQALLLRLSERRILQIQPEMSGQTITQDPAWFDVTRTSEPLPPELTGADVLLETLALTHPGSHVRIEKDSKEIGKKVQQLGPKLDQASLTGAIAAGYATKSGEGAGIHFLASVLAPLAIVAVYFTDSPYLGLLFAIPSIPGWWSDRSFATSLSANGQRMADRVSGLQVALKTQASVERYDASVKARYFMQFLPWAVALDCADAWAEACKPDEPGADMSDAAYASMNYYYFSQALSHTVSSVSESAISSYSASQSSGGGGGGFSAGGGGGGGGGGSW